MTITMQISDVVFVDLKFTPKSLVDKALKTTRQKHAGVSVQYVSEPTTTVVTHGSSGRGGRVEISKNLLPQPGETQEWAKRTRKARRSVRDAKQTFVHELRRLREFVEILKDVYGLDPIEGGD